MADTIRIVKHSASNASVKIHPFGATVLQWHAGNEDHLFVSDTALLDGSKPVRGGIPLVFPVFGPTGTSMPQHGYARRNLWTFVKDYDGPDSAGVVFELKLKDVVDGRGDSNPWAADSTTYDCTLQLTVDFNAASMTTEMMVTNTGAHAFPLQALLHTYYAVHGNAAYNPDACYVRGLEGYTIADKVTNATPSVTDATPITIGSEVDRVYSPPPAKDVVNVTIGVGLVGATKKSVQLTATGNVDGVPVPVSCVVWNPGPEKASGMGDFSDAQYVDMICVEPGILGDKNVLQPGKRATLKQAIEV